MPAASSGVSPVVSTQLIWPTDLLLEASLGSVPAVATRKVPLKFDIAPQRWN